MRLYHIELFAIFIFDNSYQWTYRRKLYIYFMYKQNLYIMVLQYMAVAIYLVMIKMKNIPFSIQDGESCVSQ